jgi:hypothetical protein
MSATAVGTVVTAAGTAIETGTVMIVIGTAIGAGIAIETGAGTAVYF